MTWEPSRSSPTSSSPKRPRMHRIRSLVSLACQETFSWHAFLLLCTQSVSPQSVSPLFGSKINEGPVNSMSSEKPQSIVIIGGVAAGASAATRARRIDPKAEITLLEKGPAVSFANCGLPYHLGGEIADRNKLLVATP